MVMRSVLRSNAVTKSTYKPKDTGVVGPEHAATVADPAVVSIDTTPEGTEIEMTTAEAPKPSTVAATMATVKAEESKIPWMGLIGAGAVLYWWMK